MSNENNIDTLFQELIIVGRRLSNMNHHWKVPNLPKVYYEPMERLEDILFKIENKKLEEEREKNDE